MSGTMYDRPRYFCFGRRHNKPYDLPSTCPCPRSSQKLGVERSKLHLVPGVEVRFSKRGMWWAIQGFVTASDFDLLVGTGRLRDVRRSRKAIIQVRSAYEFMGKKKMQIVEVFDA